MSDQVASLAVNRDSDLRSHHLVHAHELVARRMPRDVNKVVLLGDDLDPEADESVLQAVDRLLVTRDDARREDRHIPRLEHDVGVVLARDAGKSRTRLPLAARAYQYDPIAGDV